VVTGLLIGTYAGLVLLSTHVLALSSSVAVAAEPAHLSVWLRGR
jgi:hypothetical protein